jgi:hypothetical protein
VVDGSGPSSPAKRDSNGRNGVDEVQRRRLQSGWKKVDMTTSGSIPSIAHGKRRRRRRQDKPAVTARLVLDDHVKSDVGILSEDLFAELFPHLQSGHCEFCSPEALSQSPRQVIGGNTWRPTKLTNPHSQRRP